MIRFGQFDIREKSGGQAMTDKPTPTDAELKDMWQLHAADIGGVFYYARAVLQRWGQPSGAGEAAERYRNAIASACAQMQAAWDRSLRNIDAMMDERVKLGLPALPTKEHP